VVHNYFCVELLYNVEGQVQNEKNIILNPSCYLPEEVEAASQYKQSDLEFKTSGSDSMDGFWQ